MEQRTDGPIRVTVIVGHAGTQEGRRATARHGSGIEVVRPGPSEPGSLHLLTDNRPEVLILDVRLPEIGGEIIGQELRGAFPGLTVAVLAGYDHLGYLRAFAEWGRGVFRGRGFDPEAILAAACAAAERRCLLSPGTLLSRSERLPEPLTPREYEVLRLMAAGRRNREIGGELGISVKTVEFHICHVLEKLGVHSRVEAIIRARELSSPNGPASGAA
jgi:DNA-binding NarL/FixJ family response regulator